MDSKKLQPTQKYTQEFIFPNLLKYIINILIIMILLLLTI